MLDKERLQSSGVLQTQMTVLLLTLHQTRHLSAYQLSASSRKKHGNLSWLTIRGAVHPRQSAREMLTFTFIPVSFKVTTDPVVHVFGLWTKLSD